MHAICLIIIPKIIFDLGQSVVDRYIELATIVLSTKTEFSYDYHVIGGRWDGFFKTGPKCDDCYNEQSNMARQTLENNSGPVSEIISTIENKGGKTDIIDSDFTYHNMDIITDGEFLRAVKKRIGDYYVNIDYHT